MWSWHEWYRHDLSRVLAWVESKRCLQAVQGASRGLRNGSLDYILMAVKASAVCSIIVLIRRRYNRMKGWWYGIAFCRRLLLGVRLINQWNGRLRVFDPELRVAHEVVDGAARLWGLQTFVWRHGVSKSIHHTDLFEEIRQKKGNLSREIKLVNAIY